MTVSFEATTIVAVVSGVVALASFALNFVMVRRQAHMQLEGLRHRVDQEIVAWGARAIGALAEAQRLMASEAHMSDTAFAQDRLAAMRDLSAIADQGRMFFPNVVKGDHGQAKESAFQGHRQPALHAMIFAYYVLEHWSRAGRDAEHAADVLWKCRRLLVSEVQSAVDPRRRRRVITRLSKDTGEPEGRNFDDARTLADAVETLIPGVLEAKNDRIWVAVRTQRRKASMQKSGASM